MGMPERQASPFTLQERDRRWRALRASMEAEGLDALLFCANDTRGEKGGLRYVADFRPFHRFAYCLLPREGDPALILHPVLAHAGRSPWIERHVFTATPGSAIAALLSALPGVRRLGTVNADNALRLPDWQVLIAHAGLILDDGAACLESVRALKAPVEIEALRHAAEIADLCFDRLLEIARPGVSEATLNAGLSATAIAAGAEESLFLTMRAVAHGSTVRALLAAPAVAEIAPSEACIFSIELAGPGGHWVELARPLLFPTATAEARATAAVTFAALEAARAAARPGVSAAAIQHAIVAVADPDLHMVENASGHAIGQDIIEAPRIAIIEAEQIPFQAGMALTIHPMITRRDVPAIGYCADTYLMQEDGVQKLSRIPSEPWEMPH